MCEPENSPICKKSKGLGGEAVVGKAIGMPEPVLDRTATLQRFEKGAIFLTNAYGAVFISKPIFEKWQSSISNQSLPGSGDNLQKYLGCPVKDTIVVSSEVEVAYFERGMIFIRNAPHTEFDGPRQCIVYGEIYAKYKEFGEIKGILGSPYSSTGINDDGWLASNFEGGGIYWKEGVGRGVVPNGPISNRWVQLSVMGDDLGYPIEDEAAVVNDAKEEIGRSCRFENGTIFWSENSGAWDVRGEILNSWEKLGGAAGEFGFPTSGQGKTKSQKLYNNFQNGILIRDAAAPPEQPGWAIHQLEFYVERFIGNDGQDEHTSRGVNLWVPASIYTDKGALFEGTLPGEGVTYGMADATVELNYQIPGVVNDKTVLEFRFEGQDEDTFGDDLLGVVTDHFDVDNVWHLDQGLHTYTGRGEKADMWFQAKCGMRQPSKPYDPNIPFRKQAFWSFAQFDTEELSKELYAETFTDIDLGTILNLNPATWFNEAWENIFYYLVYKRIAKSGNCFGMCLESIYAQVGRSFFTEPIFQHNVNESGLMDEINIKDGYQLGADTIHWWLKEFFLGQTHNPMNVFTQTRASYTAGDYPLIAMTSSYFGAGGHVVCPYKWDDSNPQDWIIYVANPNFPAQGGSPAGQVIEADSAEGCVIHVNPETNRFSFTMGASGVRSGSVWSGSRLYYIPYSQMSTQPRTPGSDVLDLIYPGILVILGESAETQQISDQAGNTLYQPSLSGPPTQWDDIRQDDGGLSGSVARLPSLSGSDGPGPELYFARHTGADFQHRMTPRPDMAADSQYHWHMRSPTLSATIGLQTTPFVEDLITVDRAGGLEQAITLSVSDGDSKRKAELWLGGWRGLDHEHYYQYRVHDLLLSPGHTLGMRLNEAGRELVLKNDGPEVTCKVSITNSDTREVTLEAGRATRIRPRWEQPDQPWVVEDAPASLRHFLESRGLLPRLGVRAYFPTAKRIRESIEA
jgi:hypothetical protein